MRFVVVRQYANRLVVGSFHTDNAGEFISRDFTEFLANIRHTTCPPHVHQLNGVAERAIRSIVELMRSDLTVSGAPVTFRNLSS